MNTPLYVRVGIVLTFAAFPLIALAAPPVTLPADSVAVPMLPPQALNGYNYIVVPVKINSAGPFLFILDTGAERNVADTSLPTAAALKIHGGAHIRGIGPQRVASLQTEEAVIQLGAASVPRQKFYTFDMSVFSKSSGIKLSGFLGENIFKAFVVRVDYARSLLTLIPPDQFHYHGTGLVMPLTFDKAHRPQIEAQVEGIPGKFMIDTGSDATLILNTPFVEKNGLKAKFVSQGQTITETGAGGDAKIQIVPSLRVQIGNGTSSVTISGFPIGLSQAQKGAESDKDAAGAFGGALLSRFILTFDYSRNQLIFEPAAVPTPNSTASP